MIYRYSEIPRSERVRINDSRFAIYQNGEWKRIIYCMLKEDGGSKILMDRDFIFYKPLGEYVKEGVKRRVYED